MPTKQWGCKIGKCTKCKIKSILYTLAGGVILLCLAQFPTLNWVQKYKKIW